jgi:hypothetical protein
MARTKEFGRLSIQVTDADIEKAMRNDSMVCVVAQAIARSIPDAHRIAVDVQTIRWSDREGRHVYLTPYAVQGYIVAFDAGDEIHPFGFALDTRKSIPTRKVMHTAAGKAVLKAGATVRNKRARQLRIEDEIARDEASATPQRTTAAIESERADAARQVRQAESELGSVKAAYEGQKQMMREPGEGRTTTPPRVFKGARRREYGMRTLRINRPRAD